ncbi:oligosaccharide flippase family protein [Moritella sp. 36]|uniref:oligosaccharide flippase family protein n=1 Tax=Moritella sp. 36 TaxID=2746233 RepID=UPI001BAC68E1|nr:oligosaccharide flippase family protein [Moritella sp. 36]QUM89229.1 oligosaccharide flippase family protein [Moritella sp. 36]
MSKINNELNKGILHSLIGKYSLYILQITSLAILARLFTPNDFGTLAALQVLILFFQLLATSGLGPAIIHKDSINDEERDGIFSATLIIGLMLSLLFIYITPVLANWLELMNVNLLTYVLALSVFFSAISMLPLASLQKDTQFIIIGKAEIMAELIALMVCILLYFMGLGVVALAIKILVTPIGRFIFYHRFSNNTEIGKAKIGIKISSIIPLFAIAKFQLGFNILNFFSRNLDTLLVAKYFGVTTVGFYEKTYQIMRYPLQLFTFAITPALQPVLTRYKSQPDIIFTAYYQLAYKLSFLGILTATIMFWYANDIIFILFGSQWLAVSELLKILALSIPVQMVLSSTGGLYQAMGATKHMFYCGIFSSIVNVSAIIFGVYIGDMTVLCSSLVAAFILNYIQCFYVLHRFVFKVKRLKPFIILSSFVLTSLLNIFFDQTESIKPDSFNYADSFYNIANVIVPLALIFLFVFIIRRKVRLFLNDYL